MQACFCTAALCSANSPSVQFFPPLWILKIFLHLFNLFYVYECFAYMYVCVPCVYMIPPRRPEKDIKYPGTGVTDNCEPPCGCWELNLGPLQEQQVLLTSEWSLKAPIYPLIVLLFLIIISFVLCVSVLPADMYVCIHTTRRVVPLGVRHWNPWNWS